MARNFVLLLGLTTLAIVSARTDQSLPGIPFNMPRISDEPLDGELSGNLLKIRRLAVEFFDLYPNITLTDLLGDVGSSALIPSAGDAECLADLAILTRDLATFQIWALKMIDAWGNLPAGMLVGNLWDFGNYDECLAINHAVTLTRRVRGKYCFAKFNPMPSVSRLWTIKTAVCFPASCSASHMDALLRRLFQTLLNVELSSEVAIVDDATCTTTDKEPYDGLTIFTIVILSLLAAVIAASTLYDYFSCQDEKHLHPVIRALSARANSRSLFRLVEPKTNPNVIDCLNGIRCLSFIWVVYAHDYLVFAHAPNMNMIYAMTWIKSFFALFITHGVFAVDTFFFLSGLLLVLISLRYMEKTKGRLNIPMMYLHRYLRLTPLLAFAILIYMKILPLFGDGPLQGSVSFDDYSTCSDTWYLTLLYVQNVATSKLCISHSWYLAVDMQLYIFAPFLLIALYRWGKRAAAGIFILMLLLACCLFSIMVINNMSLAGGGNSMRKLYYATNTRASPYLIGLLFGYFLHLNRGREFKLPLLAVLLGWLLGLALLFTCMFSTYGVTSLPIVEEASYLTLTRIAWPLGLCWVVFACMHGYGSLANSFLSSPLWQPMSKLSYAAYIYHMFIESLNGGRTRNTTYFSDYQVMLTFWADFGFTMLLAYLMHILIEAPFANIENIIFFSKKPKAIAGRAQPQENSIETAENDAP
ncbi:hypothetical protein KR018_006478, partial [Drosophila ironensis]